MVVQIASAAAELARTYVYSMLKVGVIAAQKGLRAARPQSSFGSSLNDRGWRILIDPA